MSHIKSIGASMFSDLSVATPASNMSPAVLAALKAAADFQALFGTEIQPNGTAVDNSFVRIKNVREFPAMGTPPNIVNVPVYGQKTSQQIQGQADAPSIELTLNFVASDWDAAGLLGKMVGDGVQRVFRFTLLNTQPNNYTTGIAGIGSVENTQYFWIGKIEAMQVTPQLTDATTATITISLQSELFGAFTEGGTISE